MYGIMGSIKRICGVEEKNRVGLPLFEERGITLKRLTLSIQYQTSKIYILAIVFDGWWRVLDATKGASLKPWLQL